MLMSEVKSVSTKIFISKWANLLSTEQVMGSEALPASTEPIICYRKTSLMHTAD